MRFIAGLKPRLVTSCRKLELLGWDCKPDQTFFWIGLQSCPVTILARMCTPVGRMLHLSASWLVRVCTLARLFHWLGCTHQPGYSLVDISTPTSEFPNIILMLQKIGFQIAFILIQISFIIYIIIILILQRWVNTIYKIYKVY